MRQALKFLYHNGFGFQLEKDQVVFAKLGEQQVNLDKLRSIASSVVEIDYLGCSFVAVDCKDYTKIPALIQAMLDSGLAVKPNMKDTPIVFKNETFSWTALEHKIVQLCNERGVLALAQRDNTTPALACYKLFDEPIAWNQPWNWQTAEGKEFCKQLPSTEDFNFFELPDIAKAIEEHGLALWK